MSLLGLRQPSFGVGAGTYSVLVRFRAVFSFPKWVFSREHVGGIRNFQLTPVRVTGLRSRTLRMNRLSNKALALALVLGWAGTASAQSLEEKLQAKLAKPFATDVAWETDYDKALARAKEEGKTVFAYFTRSFQP